jgi:hypothetical protein
MEKYRIKIEELNNGEIWYSPQVLRGIWDKHSLFEGWLYLDEDANIRRLSISYNDITRAEASIKARIDYNKAQKGKEVKEVKYKNIEII